MAQIVKAEGKNFEFIDTKGDWFEGRIVSEKSSGRKIQIREKGRERDFSGGWISVKDLEDREWIERFVGEWE